MTEPDYSADAEPEYEPDYEAIAEEREEKREQAWLERMDALYGRVEDYRPAPEKADPS